MHYVTFFQQSPLFFLISIFILSICIGSFLNVVIYRIPAMMKNEWRCECEDFLEIEATQKPEKLTLSTPSSSCGSCGHKITVLENIPILSYLFLGGKCSSCKSHISIQYPVVELFTGILSVITAYHFGVTIQTVAALLFTWSLIAASGIDIGHKLLPDQIIFPLLWVGIFLNMFQVFTDLESSVIGAMAGYLSLWLVYWAFKLTTGKEGMGYGDFKLLALLGAWMGWQYLFIIILTSSLVGAVVGISYLLLKRKDRNTQIPFGPYLASAGWVTLLWGDQLQAYYFSLFNLNL
ncbi:MAG: prepilin peptidase [Gammaproteobacteria bacterium]|nr:prepilin peptidase [Gammaproteobacteria bacterium]